MANGDDNVLSDISELCVIYETVERGEKNGKLEESGSGDDEMENINESKKETDEINYNNSSFNLNDPGTSNSDATVRKFIKSEKRKKIGHRRVDNDGGVTYKNIQTTQIIGSIQLGIQHTVGGLASKPERDLLMQDFMTVESITFASCGSNHTPAHPYSQFVFKTYAPIAFRYFRDLFGIKPEDYLISFCKNSLRELINPGRSGSIFYVTDDDEFITKTIQNKERTFLQKLLPGYYLNLHQNPKTLLPKFFGLYCYQYNLKNIRLVAMNNILPSCITLHQKYDLKGSTYKRKASKDELKKKLPTYKDLDFTEHHPHGLFIECDNYNALIKTIQRDCRVLESFKIMDYSLLLGIHNLDQAINDTQDSKTSVQYKTIRSELSRLRRSFSKTKLVAHSTAMESIQAKIEKNVDDIYNNVPPGGIPAKNYKGDRLLLYLGVIDILQSYEFKKKLEHTIKSLIHDGDTISVHNPSFYSKRFQDFMSNVVFKKNLHHSTTPIHPCNKRKVTSSSLIQKEIAYITEKSHSVDLASLPSCSSTPPPEFSVSIPTCDNDYDVGV